jgi:hypothetical protein
MAGTTTPSDPGLRLRGYGAALSSPRPAQLDEPLTCEKTTVCFRSRRAKDVAAA